MDPLFVAIYVVGFVLLVVVITNAMPGPKIKLTLPKRKPKAEVDPWAGWKEIKANLDASRKREHEDWQTDFNRLVQATCAHSFPGTSQAPTYFTCFKCKYVEPWDEPHEGCKCRYEVVTTTASPFPEYNVTFRNALCKWHGTDWDNWNKHTDRSNKPFKNLKD